MSYKARCELPFFDRYELLLKTALTNGIKTVGLPSDPRNVSPEVWKKFRRACHKGYDHAQREIVHMLKANSIDNVSDEERRYRELLLRKVADAIAFTITGNSMHIIKRLCFHDRIPQLQMENLDRYLSEANRINAENRDKFTLLSDLTTFIHVADLITIDLSRQPRRVQFIELKEGTINAHIAEIVQEYDLSEDSVDKLSLDPRLTNKHQKKQATRVLRQSLRLSQAETAIEKDEGIDIATGMNVRHSSHVYEKDSYDHILRDVCSTALAVGLEAATVNYCLHLGVGWTTELATSACRYALLKTREDYNAIALAAEEANKTIAVAPLVTMYDLVYFNMSAAAAYPLTLWGLPFADRRRVAERKLIVYAALDLPAFIWFAQSLDIELSWSSRKETAQHEQLAGKRNVKSWDNRQLKFDQLLIGPGTWSRMLAELMTPYSVLTSLKRLSQESATWTELADQQDVIRSTHLQ